jgi:hypothetical protein
MKNVMKFGLALAVFLTAFAVRANDATLSVRVKEGAGKVVSFTVVEAKAIHVTIYANDGAAIFNEDIKGKSGQINRSYDLAAFPLGTYVLETETGARVSRHQIVIADKTATVIEASEILKPVVVAENGVLSIHILNAEKTPVAIKMYDDNNNELYTETVTGQEEFAKKFDIKNASAKNITLIMSYNNKTFVETVAAR